MVRMKKHFVWSLLLGICLLIPPAVSAHTIWINTSSYSPVTYPGYGAKTNLYLHLNLTFLFIRIKTKFILYRNCVVELSFTLIATSFLIKKICKFVLTWYLGEFLRQMYELLLD